MASRPSQDSQHALHSNVRQNPYAYAAGPEPGQPRRDHRHRHHWWYIWIPLAVSFIWFGSLLAMLVTWLVQGRTFLPSESPGQKLAYISDIGASFLKPLFVAACCITGVGFVVMLSIERWLRYDGRLPPHMRRREKFCAALSILSALVGGAALILLSVFDTLHHEIAHRAFLLFFVLGVALSAIFTIIEFKWLEKSNPDMIHLRYAYLVKAIFALVLIAAAIAFGATLGTKQNVACVLEWCIAFGYTLYLLTFWFDLRLSKNASSGEFTEKLHTNVVA